MFGEVVGETVIILFEQVGLNETQNIGSFENLLEGFDLRLKPPVLSVTPRLGVGGNGIDVEKCDRGVGYNC